MEIGKNHTQPLDRGSKRLSGAAAMWHDLSSAWGLAGGTPADGPLGPVPLAKTCADKTLEWATNGSSAQILVLMVRTFGHGGGRALLRRLP